MSSTVGQPVKALVESVLNGEWVIVSDNENTFLLNHQEHDLELTFAKYYARAEGDLYVSGSFLRLVGVEWMDATEKRYAEEHLNDWWAKHRKALDTERRAEARNKFMCLVEE